MSNAKYIDFVTPRGTAKYPRLNEARTYDRKVKRSVPDPEGNLEMKLLLEPKDAAVIKKAIDAAIKQDGSDPDTLPYKKEIDKDTKKETGLIEVTFKAYGKKKDGSKNVIPMFDAKARPLPADFMLTSGSVVKVAWIMVAPKGVRLNMKCIQVIEYVEPKVSNPFEEEEGFAYEANDFTEEVNGSNNKETDEGDYDF